MLSDVFRRVVGVSQKISNNGKAFLLGSFLTVYSGISLDNHYVTLGGAGLAIGAALVNRRKYEAVPYPLLVANGILTANGVLLAASGEVWAGLLLASANSIGGYGTANLRMLLKKISPEAHGVLSTAAGLQIAAAGLCLQDPLLVSIGGLFTADGLERGLSSGRKTGDVVKEGFRSLAFR
jgi:hypothetical protein